MPSFWSCTFSRICAHAYNNAQQHVVLRSDHVASQNLCHEIAHFYWQKRRPFGPAQRLLSTPHRLPA
ncbi:hypothetical protein HBI56_221350 [Parastagonospora nodorum]|nr:hypothetical protein HBI09_215130 [Parastagonospora nodorum]KAH4216839.1 hypothetical protein HBI06_222870 [Parastagonospora nodorum]KAH4226189.1 hypothetical protein HBI05_224540 [Parastagonospora nodorum]KAH4335485.1 hypothetical protein HBH98_234300 [Parastagonospora nodorum]KAH4358228.1 hypothetical protein HBH97_219500 [Parastagonospora nodorum]